MFSFCYDMLDHRLYYYPVVHSYLLFFVALCCYPQTTLPCLLFFTRFIPSLQHFY